MNTRAKGNIIEKRVRDIKTAQEHLVGGRGSHTRGSTDIFGCFDGFSIEGGTTVFFQVTTKGEAASHRATILPWLARNWRQFSGGNYRFELWLWYGGNRWKKKKNGSYRRQGQFFKVESYWLEGSIIHLARSMENYEKRTLDAALLAAQEKNLKLIDEQAEIDIMEG